MVGWLLHFTFSFDREKSICFKFLQATAEANNLAAVTEAKELYMRSMEDVCGGKKPYVATAYLETEHLRCVDRAISMFQNKRKMGGDEFSRKYMRRLKQVRQRCEYVPSSCILFPEGEYKYFGFN